MLAMAMTSSVDPASSGKPYNISPSLIQPMISNLDIHSPSVGSFEHMSPQHNIYGQMHISSMNGMGNNSIEYISVETPTRKHSRSQSTAEPDMATKKRFDRFQQFDRLERVARFEQPDLALIQESGPEDLTVSEFVYILSPLGRILFTSPAVEAYVGLTSNDMIGKSLLDYIHSDDLDEYVSLPLYIFL